MDKRFLTAFLSRKKYLVGGIKLDGFCPRHAITLQGINSPLFKPDFDKNYCYKDLFLAIRICSTSSWEDAISMPSFPDRVRLGILRYNLTAQMKALTEFLHYITESTVQPKVITKGDLDGLIKTDNKEPVPSQLAIVTFLMSKMGFSEQDAWNMPYSRIAWYVAGYASQETGTVEIISTEEEERAEKDKEDLIKFTEREKEKLKNLKKNGSR